MGKPFLTQHTNACTHTHTNPHTNPHTTPHTQPPTHRHTHTHLLLARFCLCFRYAAVWKGCLTLYTGKVGEIQKIGE